MEPEDNSKFQDFSEADAAVELARAKLKAVYGREALKQQKSVGIPKVDHPDQPQAQPSTAQQPAPTQAPHTVPTPPPQPVHSPEITRQYTQEQSIQTQFHPQQPTTSPDHQLNSPDQHFQLNQPSPTTRQQQLDSFNQEIQSKKQNTILRKLLVKIKTFVKGTDTTPGHGKPLAFALVAAVLITAFLNNRFIIGTVYSYISPGDRVVSPAILEAGTNLNVGPESKVIIPKINVEVPVVYDEPSYDDREVQAALERGVVHYGNTAVPGEIGNNVIVGHSSNSIWNDGKYKFAFVLLDRLDNGDTFMLNYEGQQYVYEVYEKRVIEPDDFSVLNQDVDEPIVTLITCTPPGTSWRRLIVVARQILPDTDQARPAQSNAVDISQIDEDVVIPGTADSFWDRARDWLF